MTRLAEIILGISTVFALYVLHLAHINPGTIFMNAVKGQFYDLFLLLGGIVFVALVLTRILYEVNKKLGLPLLSIGKNKDKIGTSEFATIRDLKSHAGNDGLVIGKSFRLSAKKAAEHLILVGPTGSGKSVSYFIPNLLMLPKNASVIVSDPKGELFQKTAFHALKQGKHVLVFSPYHDNSMKYNPLALCRNVSEIRELAQVLLANGNAAIEAITGKSGGGGSEWISMSTPLLTAFLIFVRDLPTPNNTISYALNLITRNELDTLKALMDDAEEAAQDQFHIFMQSAGSERTMSSIKTTLATNLQLFMDPMIKAVTSDNEIDPVELRKHPTHLYVVVPEMKSAAMAPLMAPFYTQILDIITEHRGCPVYVLLDEFANIGLLPNLDSRLATVRSREISFSLGIQSVNQLEQRYGKAAKTILDNCKCKVFYQGLSHDSSDYASKMLGVTEIQVTNTSRHGATITNISQSTSKQRRELMTQDEIRRLGEDDLLMVLDNKKPYLDKKYLYYEDKKLSALASQEMNINQFINEFQNKKVE